MSQANLDTRFADFLNIFGTPAEVEAALMPVFLRDMVDHPCMHFNGKPIVYVRGPLDAQRAFNHLTKKEEDGGRKYFDFDRAKRLHWVKYFLEKGLTKNKFWVFSYVHPKHGLRTYIYHKKLKFVVILEPSPNEYFLVSAFYVKGTGIESMEKKFANKLPNLM
ncbi:MAG: hypothetical protein V4547_14225 [Bacteroidota bacterium]